MAGQSEAYQKAMQLGHTAAWEQDWHQASGYYTQALEAVPDDSKALSSLGLAHYELHEYEAALRYYMRAARVAPGDPLPFEKVAVICEFMGRTDNAQMAALQAAELYLKNRDIEKALENWERVLRLNPENIRALTRLAVIYEHMGRKEAAVQVYLALAGLYQHNEELENAVRVVNRALQIIPGSQEARQALSYLRDFKLLPHTTRRPSTATRAPVKNTPAQIPAAQQQEETINPIEIAHRRALKLLAGMMFDASGDEPVEQVTRRGLQSLMRGTGNLAAQRRVDWSRIILHLSQVIDLQDQEQYEQAAEELERAMEAGLDHPAAYFELGYLRLKTNRMESSARSLQYAITHPDFSLAGRLLLGQILHSTGRLREASVEYMQALRLADAAVVPEEQAEDLNQLYEPLVEAQGQQEDKEIQERVCRNIGELLMRPDWRSQLQRARRQLPARANGGPPVPLAEILTEARSSQAVEALTNIYQLAAQGSLRSAMEEAFYAIQYAPTYLPLHAHIAELLLQQGQFQDAINKFLVVAQTYSTRGEPKRAIEFYRRVIELAPMDLKPRSRLIDQLIAMDRLDDALQEYLDFAEVHYNLADLDNARKTYTEALQVAQQSGVETAWRVRIMHRMADIDLQGLDWRQALRVYEQIIGLDPGDEKARASLIELNNRLGQEKQSLNELDQYIAYLTAGGRRAEAITFVESLVKENSSRPLVRKRLAQLFQRAGRKEDAIQQYDAAGELLLQQGDRQGAVEIVEAIIALNPDNIAEYRRLVSQLRR